MDKRSKLQNEYESDSAIQHEDAALKTAMQFFAQELLPYFGIKEKVVSFAPTEQVHLDLQKLFQDFNLVMEDGSWKHFEFQSTNEGRKGLKRFRAYEAISSYQNQVPVTTYVLFSGKIRKPMTYFTEGINTYRIVPIIMRDLNADQLFEELNAKVECDEKLTKQDLVPLTLCMLMSGAMELKERIITAYEITRKATMVDSIDVGKIEAVLYIMADKFLDAMDMEEIVEEISMTRLGQKLVDRGREEEKIEIAKNLLGILDEYTIAERTGLSLERVRELKKEAGPVAV
ncbi:hypothetical protein ABXS75_08710 [Roseburia hominis]